MLIWQSRRSCLISNSSLPLWKMFCKADRKNWHSEIQSQSNRSDKTVKVLPQGTVASSVLVSSGSVKFADSCCPLQQWHHLLHSGTCDLVMIPWRSSSLLRCSYLPFDDACTKANWQTDLALCIIISPENLKKKKIVSHLCSCSAWLMSTFDTTSP